MANLFKLARVAGAAVLAAAAALPALPAFAGNGPDGYPQRPLRIIVGFAPGGGTDILARMLVRPLQEQLGQSIIIDNRPGAGGAVVTGQLKSLNDGYTVMVNSVGPLAVMPHMGTKMPYDVEKDIAPLTLMAVQPNALVVNASLPVKNLKEYVEYVKEHPKESSYGSSGIAGGGHLSGELFRSYTKLPMSHVPYRGGAPAMTDLLGNQIPALFSTLPALADFIPTGRIRILGVTGSKRSPMVPDIPTIAEQGYPGYEVLNWYCLVAPAGMPEPILKYLNAEFVKAIKSPEVQKAMALQGYEPAPGSREELHKFIVSESAKWAKLVKDADIK
ncbi:MAG: tripartite tricarboxylate transporter substrate binding protein [Pseudomonadota bacterium]